MNENDVGNRLTRTAAPLGIIALRAGRKALASWLATLRSTYAERVLPIDATIATIWGRLTALVERRGGLLGVVDGLIAATALHHGYTVVTRNIADFAGTGVPVINVWER